MGWRVLLFVALAFYCQAVWVTVRTYRRNRIEGPGNSAGWQACREPSAAGAVHPSRVMFGCRYRLKLAPAIAPFTGSGGTAEAFVADPG
jgi:hypothetical protein